MFGWPACLTSGFSGNLALEICFILSFVSLYVIRFEPNKYLLLLLLLLLGTNRDLSGVHDLHSARSLRISCTDACCSNLRILSLAIITDLNLILIILYVHSLRKINVQNSWYSFNGDIQRLNIKNSRNHKKVILPASHWSCVNVLLNNITFWPFGVTWRHRSRDHSTPHVGFPIGGQWWPCVYIAPLVRYKASN